jgi:NAD(P)-dependent dehydrogenase (short-subunit alcohol dehydrogenase family)
MIIMRLKDKVAIVTGGSSGIGRWIALGFAREGAHIVVADINPEDAEETLTGVKAMGRKGLDFKTDVSDPGQVNSMITAVLDAFGRIDILVNAASDFEAVSILDSTIAQWDRIMGVNLRGALLCIQAAGRIMGEQGRGKIINITSLAAFQGRPSQQAYCASKGGILALTKSAALQMAPQGVYVNAIATGVFDTSFAESRKETDEVWQQSIEKIPFGRPGRSEDIAGPAIFLASDESDYITGQTIIVDGGSSIRIKGDN